MDRQRCIADLVNTRGSIRASAVSNPDGRDLVLSLGIGRIYGPIIAFALLGTIFTVVLIFCYVTVILSWFVHY